MKLGKGTGVAKGGRKGRKKVILGKDLFGSGDVKGCPKAHATLWNLVALSKLLYFLCLCFSIYKMVMILILTSA